MSNKIIDDTETFIVNVTGAEEGLANIVSTDIPDSVQPNTGFTIKYTVINNGAADTLWGHIMDTDTNTEISGTYWEADFNAGETKQITVTFAGGITSSLHGKIEVGHIED